MDSMGKVAQGCALAVMLAGVAVLAAWALGIEGLKSVLPGLATMKANTALCFTLSGAALALRGQPRLRLALAGAVLALAGLTLVQEFTGSDLGIDQALFRDAPGAAETVAPGRMSPATAVSFVLSAAALLLLGGRTAARRAAEALALGAGATGAIALLGYAYGVEQLYRLPGFGSMALHTATAFVVLAAGILCARPDGIAGAFASPSVGGQLARRLLPLALVIPALLGWLEALGQRAGLFGPAQGTALFASTMILALVALIWRTALSMDASDAGRLRVEDALRKSEHELNHAQAVAHTGSWRLDMRRNELLWSEENHRIFGIPEGTPMSYESFLAIVHPDDREYVHREWTAALGGAHYDIEHRIVVGDTVKWVRERAELEFDREGVLLGAFGTTQDITAAKRAEDLLRSVALFPEENPHPVMRAAGDGTLSYANAAAAPLLEQWHCPIGGQLPEFLRRVLAKALEAGERQELDTRCGGRHFSFVLVPIVEHQYVNLYGRDVTERRAAEDSMRDYADRLQALSRRLLEIQETERRAIARELHDEIGQVLTAVKINLQSAERRQHKGIAAPGLKDSVEIVEDAIQRVRNRSLDLRPTLLDDLGLVPTIRWYLERHASQAGFTVQIVAEPLVPRPPPEVETSCFRVVQEAVTNAMRHARAKNLRVELRGRAGRLDLSIRDDGVGFDVEAARRRALEGGSIGLLGMEERVEFLGGDFAIDSAPGKGTLIRVTLPVPGEGTIPRGDGVGGGEPG